jgi:hypothetical protein
MALLRPILGTAWRHQGIFVQPAAPGFSRSGDRSTAHGAA